MYSIWKLEKGFEANNGRRHRRSLRTVSQVQSGNEAERVRFHVDPRACSRVLVSIVGNGRPAMHIGAVHHRRLKRYVIFNSRSISWPNREPTHPTRKNACRPPFRFCRVASGKSGGSYIYRPSTLPRVSLTIRGQPPARVPSTLPTYVCIYAKTHFHLFFSLFFFFPLSLRNHSRITKSRIGSHSSFKSLKNFVRAVCSINYFERWKYLERDHVFLQIFFLIRTRDERKANFFITCFAVNSNQNVVKAALVLLNTER